MNQSAIDLRAATLAAAVRALQYARAYDTLRLETYREKEHLSERIRLRHFGSAIALRFDEVGYFNRVYCPDESVFDRLPEVEEFYRGGPYGCELVGPPCVQGEIGTRSISRPGWDTAHRLVWLHAHGLKALVTASEKTFEIRSPEPEQRVRFLHTYLRAFEAQEDRIPAAVRNMRHLFDRPGLDFLMASHGGEPAGVGMMMRSGNAALLCAGAVLPDFRERGCHAALLAARIRLAAASGAEELFSWANLGSQSQANMERAGLSPVGATLIWRFAGERG